MLEERTILTDKRDPGFFPLVARLILGVVFIYASIDKILYPADFAGAVYKYQILTGSLINLTAIILPWLELILGLLLIVGVWVPGASSLSTLLLITFFGVILFNIARGLDFHCGCFSEAGPEALGAPMYWYMVRDGVFLLLALLFPAGVLRQKAVRGRGDPINKSHACSREIWWASCFPPPYVLM